MRIRNFDIIFAVVSLGAPLFAEAAPQCSAATLAGTYLWAGTGATAPAGTWVPKAINEQMHFDGAGAVTVLAGTIANRNADGQVVVLPPGTAGTYSVDPGCTARVQFTPAPGFNVVVSPNGRVGNFIQTDVDNVLQGTLVRVSSN